jgi:hypothetical protein
MNVERLMAWAAGKLALPDLTDEEVRWLEVTALDLAIIVQARRDGVTVHEPHKTLQ